MPIFEPDKDGKFTHTSEEYEREQPVNFRKAHKQRVERIEREEKERREALANDNYEFDLNLPTGEWSPDNDGDFSDLATA